MLWDNPRNTRFIRGSHYGKRGVVYGDGGLSGLGDNSYLNRPADPNDPNTWQPMTTSFIDSIMLKTEGQAYNESLSAYATPLGVYGGNIISWVKNNLPLIGFGLIGLLLLPHLTNRR